MLAYYVIQLSFSVLWTKKFSQTQGMLKNHTGEQPKTIWYLYKKKWKNELNISFFSDSGIFLLLHFVLGLTGKLLDVVAVC